MTEAETMERLLQAMLDAQTECPPQRRLAEVGAANERARGLTGLTRSHWAICIGMSLEAYERPLAGELMPLCAQVRFRMWMCGVGSELLVGV